MTDIFYYYFDRDYKGEQDLFSILEKWTMITALFIDILLSSSVIF